MELKNFDEMLALVPKGKSFRAAVAGSDSENVLKAVFQAQGEGFIQPILVGDRARTAALLDKLGFAGNSYEMVEVSAGASPAKVAIDLINSGKADILVRGNILAHEMLPYVLNKTEGLYDGRMLSHVSLASLPDYPKLIALSDMAVIVQPDLQKKKAMLVNMAEAFRALGYEDPKLALMAVVEHVTFHARDTVDAQTLMIDQARTHYVDAQLWGPISYDLIVSKEAARLKGYDCPWCGEGFDGILAPELTLANTLVKSWLMHSQSDVSGVVVGAKAPIAFPNRSASAREHYLSIAFAAIMADKK